ncbi:hypothetical protein [Natrinema salinisoli]|uniref:hypothetical protein n=1 Tax=Natrinema salinisoli TaxID=2878535 RepID=UPI001CF065D0|nr:hypothetical protein [Natrinema salinisoli]
MKLIPEKYLEHIVLFAVSIVLLLGAVWMIQSEYGPIALVLAGMLMIGGSGLCLSLQRLSRDLRGGGPDTTEA